MKNHFTPVLRIHLALGLICCTSLIQAGDRAQMAGGRKAIEGESRFELSWSVSPGAIYRLQASTNLSNPNSWQTVDYIQGDAASGTNIPVKWMAPESLSSRSFYRISGPDPELTGVEPAFIDASDSNAVLYLLGQSLPTNGTVMINGQSFSPEIVNSNGVWATVRLNGLPPGIPVTGRVQVIDNGTSNVVATLPVESPLIYGTNLTVEQMQGPPEDPPASPLGKKEFKGHVTLLKLTDDEGPPDAAARQKEFKGHVSLLKRGDSGSSSMRAGGHKKTGHVSLLKRTSARAGGGPDDDCDGTADVMGELRCQVTDLEVPGRGLDFAWTRTYRSRTGPNTAQGPGWDHSYNVTLTRLSDGNAQLCPGNGRCDTFYADGTNGWFRSEYFVVISDLDRDGYPDVVTFADSGRWTFNPPGTAAGGKLASIVDRNGNTITLNYDGLGRLDTIVDTLGRTNTVGYTRAGQVESVTDFSGRVVRYEYDGNGDLVACVSPPVTGTPTGNDFPGGITNRYVYSSGFGDDRLNHNLMACTDGKGQTWLQAVYQTTNNPAALDFDAVDFVQRGPYREYLRRYAQTPSAANNFALIKTIACDAVGNVTECFYDSRLRCVRELAYTGRSNPDLPVTENSNRPTGKLRKEDPDFFETTWRWNADSLCVRETRPSGDSTEITYQRAFNQNSARSNNGRLHDGDLRVLRERASGSGGDLDGDGVPETTELVWNFEYDSRFGSPAGRNWRQSVISGRTGRHGWDGTIKGIARGPRQSTSLDGSFDDGNAWGAKEAPKKPKDRPVVVDSGGKDQDCDGFVTRFTDPRGNVVACDYDAQGNRVRSTMVIKGNPSGSSSAVVELAHNTYGQLTAITNAPDGTGFRRVDTLSYYSSGPQAGYLQSVVIDDRALIGLRLTTSFECDARGNVTRCVDPRGNDTLHVYNALDQLVRSQTPTNLTARCTTDCFYDANGNLAQASTELRDSTDALVRNVLTVCEYDFLDRCVAVAEQASAGHFVTNRFSYDGNGNVTVAQSPLAVSGADPGSFVTCDYDERNLLWRRNQSPGTPLACSTEFSYNPNGQVTVCVVNRLDSVPARRTMAYDGFNRCVSMTDPMGNMTVCAYDRNANLIVKRVYGEANDVPEGLGNQLLSQCVYAYDSQDRQISAWQSHFTAPGQVVGDGYSTTTFSHAPNGQLLFATDDNGRVTSYAYDSVGRCSQITDPKTNVVQFTYDAGDNLVSMVSIERSDLTPAEQRFTRTYTYDTQGRCVATLDNVGNPTSCAYDSLHRLVRGTNAKGNVSWSSYDDLGRCTLSIGDLDGDGLANFAVDTWRSSVWDDNSRCVSTTDGNTNTTFYAYDSRNRLLTVTNADGTTHKLIWSPRSNVVAEEDANGTTTTNTYDLCDRLVHRDIAARGAAMPTTTFETFAYDGCSRLVLASNDVSLSTFAYDSLDNCVRSTQDGLSTACVYDGVGNRLSMTYPGGRAVSYSYNPLNEVASMSSTPGGVPPVTLASYAYEGPGRVGRISRGNGINTRFQWNGLVSPSNADGDYGWRQVRGVNHAASGGNPVIDQRRLTYDRNQNKVLREQMVPFVNAKFSSTNLFSHDARNRQHHFVNLRGASSRILDWALDKVGNRQSETNDGAAGIYSMSATIPPGDFQMCRYTVTPFGSKSYDANGNLVASGSGPDSATFYRYDYADRLVAVQAFSTLGTLDTLASFNYDALGRRISKTTYPPTPLAPVTTQYVKPPPDQDCDGLALEERVAGAVSRVYCWGGNGLDMNWVCFTGGGEAQYAHADDLGNVLALTDVIGNVLERYDYDAAGAPTFLAADGTTLVDGGGLPLTASAQGNPYLFRGMVWDGETGLYIEGTPKTPGRYVDPKTGSYLSSGPAGEAGTELNDVNRRVFAGGNPWSSPAGRSKQSEAKSNTKAMFTAEKAYRSSGSGGGGGGSLVLKKEEGGRHTPFHNKYESARVITDRDSGRSKGFRSSGGNAVGAGQVNEIIASVSAIQSRNILKTYFETGDIPTQDQFHNLIDSMVHLNDDGGSLLMISSSKTHTKTGHVTLLK